MVLWLRKFCLVITFMFTVSTQLATVPLSCSAKTPVNPKAGGQEFLSRVDADEKLGLLPPDLALLYRFQYIFAPDDLPDDYRMAGFSPLKCGTDLVRQYHQMKERLDPAISRLIEAYLDRPEARLSYISPEGNFQLTYQLTGQDAVPAEDLDPANGVPDFVERVGEYFEQAWLVEVFLTGFADPLVDGQFYQVSFRAMQNYGYTYIQNSNLGTTGIVLHNNYSGFPPNDDPDGNTLGAAKVSAAHEFKHASQYVGSRWAEGGWIELDAVWVEDLVFDQANDYYNYLIGGSPIRHPEVSLDGGTTDTGSYEDCVFQTWMQEKWGEGIIVDFWQRRMTHTYEPVLATYGAILQEYGQGLDQEWGEFTAWNFATGYRSLLGLGYEEAGRYPSGYLVANLSEYPVSLSGSIEHLAADFVRLLGFVEGQDGSLDLSFSFEGGSPPLTLALVIQKYDGTGVLEMVDLQGTSSVQHTAGVSLREIQTAGVVIGNPALDGTARGYELTVRMDVQFPVPLLVLETAQVQAQVTEGSTSLTYALIGNEGQDDSVLHFQTSVWAVDPEPVFQAGCSPDKNISGSGLTSAQSSYLAGTSISVDLTVNNGSTDDEWLTDVQLSFPAGVTLGSASSFSGGSLGDLLWNGSSGDGVTTAWHGEYGSQGYGVIRDGEWATAELDLNIAADFSGPLTITGTIIGDQFGSDPHSVTVWVTLDQFVPQLDLLSPVADQLVPLGVPVTVSWEQDGTLDTVLLSLSRDGGQSWSDLAEVPANTGSYEFVPEGLASMDCQIRISAMDGLIEAVSEGSFTIYPAAAWAVSQTSSGEVTAGSLGAIILQFNATEQLPGDMTAWLVVQHDGSGFPGVIPVTMLVMPTITGVNELPAVTSLAGNYPNPFNPATEIRFELAEEVEVGLEILDIRGRRVRGLVSGTLGPGIHQVNWNGRDDNGRTLPTGVYLVRMRAGGYSATSKMTLAK